LGGRIAEELIFGKDAVTTGASNDIERATELAHKMVKTWGMSEEMGTLAYSEDQGNTFMGQSQEKQTHVSEYTFQKIDSEIRKIIDKNYSTAYKLLEENRDILESMTAALMEFETIDEQQIDDLMARRELRPAAEVVDSDEISEEIGVGAQTGESTNEVQDKKSGRILKKFT
jgi:cell division protease FtsH